MTSTWRPELVLCNVSMATVAFADFVDAAASAGFDAISLLGRSHRRATQRDGLTDRDMRRLLDDHGLVVTDVEAAGRLARATSGGPADLPPPRVPGGDLPRRRRRARSSHGRRRALRRAGPDRLGRRTLRCAVRRRVRCAACEWRSSFPRSPRSPTSRRRGRSCASPIVRTPGSCSTSGITAGAATTTMPSEAVDGSPGATRCSSPTRSADPIGPPLEDVTHRRLPGEGALGVVDHVRTLDELGVARTDRHRGLRRSRSWPPGRRRRPTSGRFAAPCRARPAGISIISY